MFETFVTSALVKVDKFDKDPNTKNDETTAKDFLWVSILIEIMQNCTRIKIDEVWQERRKYCQFKAGLIIY